MNGQRPNASRYWAFISYSRQDKRWARWLHRAIEAYGIPAHLVSHRTPTGDPAPRHFQPIFHDLAELPASPDLDAKIEDALRASRFLIVICSPQAARSQWVNREIEIFQELGRRDRVLALIVAGEPHAGDRECFPPALGLPEPVAADARPEGDGRTNAKLKLLAGMLGVGFDDLKHRDSQRRIHRLEKAVVVACFLVMGFASLAWYAKLQGDKAIHARYQAENILEYLLYDLRDKLTPLGNLDIVRDIQRQVDAYYRELGVEKGDRKTLRNRATAYDNEGNRLKAEGKFEEARKAYLASLGIRERLARADTTNTQAQRDLSVSHQKIGDVLLDQGNPTGALKEYRTDLEIAERLAQADTTSTVAQRDLSVSHEKIGDLLSDQNNPLGALQSYRASLVVRKRLAQGDTTNTGWQHDLSVSHSKVGDLLLNQNDWIGALQSYRESDRILQQLTLKDTSNALWLRDLSASRDKVGDALFTMFDFAGAMQAYRASIEVAEHLAQRDPSNAEWQRDLSVSHNELAKVLLMQRDAAGALREYRAGLQIAERLAKKDTAEVAWQRDLWIAYYRQAEVSRKTGIADSLEWWRKSYRVLFALKRRVVSISPQDEKILEELRKKIGE